MTCPRIKQFLNFDVRTTVSTRFYRYYFFKSLTSGKKEFSKKEDKMDYLSPASCKETTGWLKSQSMQVNREFPLLNMKKLTYNSIH